MEKATTLPINDLAGYAYKHIDVFGALRECRKLIRQQLEGGGSIESQRDSTRITENYDSLDSEIMTAKFTLRGALKKAGASNDAAVAMTDSLRAYNTEAREELVAVLNQICESDPEVIICEPEEEGLVSGKSAKQASFEF